MRRREFIAIVGGAAAAWPLAARAQQATKNARIGFLRQAGPSERDLEAFRNGMRALGYREGQNMIVEQRYAAGAYHQLGALAADLVRLNLDVIVVDGPAAAKAAKAATTSIPIVFALGADPVADGLVISLARPGGNLTGLTLSVGYQLAGKRVEFLKDMKPDLVRLAILTNPDNPTVRPYLVEVEKVAVALGLTTQMYNARTVSDFAATFAAIAEWRADGVTTLNDGMFFSQRERIVALLHNHHLASVHPEAAFVEDGGLMSYGPSLPDLFRQSATYVGKILNGEKPAELPVEQPSKFELVVNLKTAHALGLNVSREFLLRADEVIE